MASYYFLLKEADAVEQLKNVLDTINVSKYKQILRKRESQEKRICLLCCHFIQLNHFFCALFTPRYGSFVGSSCTPAVHLVPPVKITEGTLGCNAEKEFLL